MKTLYFDTETTDFNPGQIVQLSYIIENNGGAEKAKNYFFTVDAITDGAYKTHGISVEDSAILSGGRKFKDNFQEIHEDFEGAVLVGHNVAFDNKFISSEFWRCGVSFKPTSSFCTMQHWKEILQIPNTGKALRYGKFKNPKLEEVVERLNINMEKIKKYSEQLFNDSGRGYHDARVDTTAMFVAVNIQREINVGRNDWMAVFCN